MSIAWQAFTPGTALAGGVLIGLAVAGLLYFSARIAGISGLLGGLLARASDWPLRASFLAGLLLAPWLWRLGGGSVPPLEAGWGMLISAGLLVGYGTRMGSGCTSGHGVCGLARLSPRSLLATACFMASGFAVVALLRHGLGG